MRRTTTFFALTTLLLAGCSERHREDVRRDDPQNKFGFAEARSGWSVTTADVAPPAAMEAVPRMAAPGIDVTAAPGVAFNYRYAFVLPDKSISALQEQHASACEKLGPLHCRIIGMRYMLSAEDEVRGQLRFKLDPALARAFGKEGIAAIEKAKGRLVDAAIEGVDMGTAITQSQRRSAQIEAEIGQIDQQLASGRGFTKTQLTELKARIERLRAQQAREGDTRQQGEEMLANTPMTFDYVGDKGFTLGGDAIGDAWTSSQSSFTTMVSVILLGLGILLPWAALVALLVFVWRKTPLRGLRLRRRKAEIGSDEPTSSASPPVP
jgi:hypothetical protein